VTEGARVPAWARGFVAAFFTLFVVCAVAGINAWPFSGWRLFSQARTEHVAVWTARGVNGAGEVGPIPFRLMPPAYASFGLLMRDFPSLPEARQVAMCSAWIEGARAAGVPVVSIRLVRLDSDLLPRSGRRAAEGPQRTVAFECGPGWIHAVGTHAVGSPSGPG
jgi:hypothetical protein